MERARGRGKGGGEGDSAYLGLLPLASFAKLLFKSHELLWRNCRGRLHSSKLLLNELHKNIHGQPDAQGRAPVFLKAELRVVGRQWAMGLRAGFTSKNLRMGASIDDV